MEGQVVNAKSQSVVGCLVPCPHTRLRCLSLVLQRPSVLGSLPPGSCIGCRGLAILKACYFIGRPLIIPPSHGTCLTCWRSPVRAWPRVCLAVGWGQQFPPSALRIYPATRNRTRDHLIAAEIYSQMLYQLSYSRSCTHNVPGILPMSATSSKAFGHDLNNTTLNNHQALNPRQGGS